VRYIGSAIGTALLAKEIAPSAAESRYAEERDDAHAQVMAHLRAKGMTDREAFDAADEVLAALSK